MVLAETACFGGVRSRLLELIEAQEHSVNRVGKEHLQPKTAESPVCVCACACACACVRVCGGALPAASNAATPAKRLDDRVLQPKHASVFARAPHDTETRRALTQCKIPTNAHATPRRNCRGPAPTNQQQHPMSFAASDIRVVVIVHVLQGSRCDVQWTCVPFVCVPCASCIDFVGTIAGSNSIKNETR